jgi:hypothetical protein
MKTIDRIFRWENARLFIIILAIVGISAEAFHALNSPSISLLPPHFDGEWMRPNDTVSLDAHRNPVTAAVFRKSFVLDRPQQDLNLAVTVFRDLKAVSLDGNQLPFYTPSSWKQQIHVAVPATLLSPGEHELRITAVNSMAPPLIHVQSSLLRLGDAGGWEETTIEGRAWRPVIRAGEHRSPDVMESFPSIAEGLKFTLPIFLPLFFTVFLLSMYKPKFCNRIREPETVRLLLFALSAILLANNLVKIDTFITYLGFDTKEHLDYIYYILENHRIPLATEGWQMFQPPLYYTLSAAILLFFKSFLPAKFSHLLLAVIPYSCMILLVEISYRMLKELLPGKKNLQSLGLIVAGLLPMNLYMCQVVGNEPLTAVLSALLLFMTVRYLKRNEDFCNRDAVALGIIAGLALLSKVTPLILIPVTCFFIFIVVKGKPGNYPPVKAAGIFAFTILLISGWFFLRNWIILGKPFYGGWDPARKIVWWQEPGYRLVQDYFTFGKAMVHPVYSAFEGFADGLYSTFWGDGYNICEHLVTYPEPPHWNYDALAASVGLSVVPAVSMLVGVIMAFYRSSQRSNWPFTFLLAAIGVYLAALIHLFTLVPIFSTVKASYTMGLTPCYAVMAALGAEPFTGKKYIGPLFVSLLVSWGAITYLGFFIL